ncbi:hypothetical protein ACIQHY_05750 [Streptomyces sp. NPDC092359]|uniref:hypothetical protein n=1 Tax=Streptomyces sp. NPDC092359 TaxID=3366014 RepID=UPI0037F44253
MANLFALYALGLPGLLSEPLIRHEALSVLLWDAQKGSAHAMLLGACGSLLAFVVWKPETTGAPMPGADDIVARMQAFRRRLLTTVWSNIGTSLAVTSGAVVLLFLLPSETVQRGLSTFTEALCPAGTARTCAEGLSSSVFPEPPGTTSYHRVSPTLFSYVRLYATQCFCLVFAWCVFLLRSCGGGRKGPAATLLTGWIAYVMGMFAYSCTAEIGLRAGEGRPVTFATVHELVLPPESLPHTLLAAPAVGCVLALCSMGARGIASRHVREKKAPDDG